MGYLANFMVYTLAMVGVIVIALLVFKGATYTGGKGKSSKLLKVIDTMSLGPRKTLYIVSTGSENFLIAGDVDKTTLISKLDNSCGSNNSSDKLQDKEFSIPPKINSPLTQHDSVDNSNIGIKSSLITNNRQNSVIKNIADVLRK